MNTDAARLDAVGKTCLLTTALRARESARPDRLYDDPYAAALAGEIGVALLDEVARTTAATRPAGTPDTMSYNAIRTRFLDDWVLRTPHDQVVIAAAGMDTRAYRLDWPHPVTVFEIDRPMVLELKESALAGHRPAAGVTRVPVPANLVLDDWPAALLNAGFDPARPSAWLLEGVLYYLRPADVRGLLAGLGEFCVPGSTIATDLVNEVTLTAPTAAALLRIFADWGAPWISGSDEPEKLFAEFGFDVTAVQPGEPAANYGRWPDAVFPRDVPGVPRVFYVHGERR